MQRVFFSRDDSIARAVEAGNRNPVGIALKRRQSFRFIAAQCRHRAVEGQRLHQTPARRDQFQAVRQAEDAGDVFTHAMPHHRRRLDAPRLPQFCQRVFDSEQGGLGVGGLMQCVSRTLIQQFQQRRVQVRAQQRVAFVDKLAEIRLGVVQLPPHAGILRTLTSEQKGDFLRAQSRDLPVRQVRFAVEKRAQVLSCLGNGFHHQSQPVIEMAASDLTGRADFGKRRIGMIGKIVGIVLRQLPQCIFTSCGQR